MEDQSILETAISIQNDDRKVYDWVFTNMLPIFQRYTIYYRLDIAIADDIFQEIMTQLIDQLKRGKLNGNETTIEYFLRRFKVTIGQQYSELKNIRIDDIKGIEMADDYAPDQLWKISEDDKFNNEFSEVEFLYKFMPINQHTYDLLNNNELWYSDPLSFNDPFDCALKIVKVENKHDHELNKRIADELSKIGVSCFSYNYRDILMWSHYADKHKGICLIFDYKKDIDYFKPRIIDYTNEDTSLAKNMEKDELIKKLIYTKSESWNHEDEIRSIKTNPGSYKFDEQLLKGIIFGFKSSNQDIETIKKIIADKYSNIEIFIMKRIDNKFEIEKHPI